MLALVVDGRIVSIADALPPLARDTTTGDWVVPTEGQWTPDDLARVGLHPVVETPCPTSTDTTTYTRSVVLLAGVPTVTWAPRPWLPGERPRRPLIWWQPAPRTPHHRHADVGRRRRGHLTHQPTGGA